MSDEQIPAEPVPSEGVKSESAPAKSSKPAEGAQIADKEQRPARGVVTRLLNVFGDRPLELAGVVLTLGSFVSLLVLIIASFNPNTPELALIKGFQALLTMASIGIIAVIASRQTEKFITALAIVIVAIVFVSIDDLVRLYVTVTGTERDITGILSRRSSGSAEVAGGKQDFRETAQRIRMMIENRYADELSLSENSARILQEDIRRTIVEAEHGAIVERIVSRGADELLSEIHDGEFVVSYLKYEGLPEFQADLQLLRFEGLIDDRYGDMPDTVLLTDLGCQVLARVRGEDIGCREPGAPEAVPDAVSPLNMIGVDQRKQVAVSGLPAFLTLDLRQSQVLQIDAVPANGSDLDPYIEVYKSNADGEIELVYYDDDGGGGLNSRVLAQFDAGSYLISVFDLFGGTGEISVSVNAPAAADDVAARESIEIAPGSRPIVRDLFVGSERGAEVVLSVSEEDRRIRFEAQSTWLDTMIAVFEVDGPDDHIGDWNRVADNDDRGPDTFNSCVEVELEAGLYVVRVRDYDNLTGEATAVFSNAEDYPTEEPCDVRLRFDQSAEQQQQ